MIQNNLHAKHRERMREKFIAADETHTVEDSFRDHELLELLLFFSQPRVNTNETAHRLLAHFGGVRGVIEAPFTKLIKIDGVGPQTAILIRLLCALVRKYTREEVPSLSECRLTDLPELIPVIRRMYAAETATEHVYLMLFGADGIHKKTIRLSDGTQTGVTLDIPRCVRLAFEYNAAAVILVHNHPLSALPSPEDVALTARLKDTFDSVRIELREHLVLTNDACYGILRGGILPEKTIRRKNTF